MSEQSEIVYDENNVVNWEEDELMEDPITLEPIQKDRQTFIPIDGGKYICYDVASIYEWIQRCRDVPHEPTTRYCLDCDTIINMSAKMKSLKNQFQDIAELLEKPIEYFRPDLEEDDFYRALDSIRSLDSIHVLNPIPIDPNVVLDLLSIAHPDPISEVGSLDTNPEDGEENEPEDENNESEDDEDIELEQISLWACMFVSRIMANERHSISPTETMRDVYSQSTGRMFSDVLSDPLHELVRSRYIRNTTQTNSSEAQTTRQTTLEDVD
jgi:hypothetical protein